MFTSALLLYLFFDVLLLIGFSISASLPICLPAQQNKVRKAHKKIEQQNLQVAKEMAELAASDGKAFCIFHVDVGLDTAAVREAVCKVMEKVIFTSFFSLASYVAWFFQFVTFFKT